METALELVKTSIGDSSLKQNKTFFNGMVGLYSLATVICSNLAYKNRTSKYFHLLLNHIDDVNLNENQLFNGYSGLVSCILFVYEHLPDEFEDKSELLPLLGKYTRRMFSDSMEIKHSLKGYKQFGAAVGLAGILFVLMHDGKLLSEQSHKAAILSHLEKLVQLNQGGSFPVSDSPFSGEINDPLRNQWCQGAPGIIFTLVKAYNVFGDEKYLKVAEEVAEKIWERGLVLKGANLCHGVCGNAYSFLALYNATSNDKKEKYLYYASQFCVAAANPEINCQFIGFPCSRKVMGIPDYPFSLMEGIAGEACFYLDMLRPSLAQFPGFGWKDIL